MGLLSAREPRWPHRGKRADLRAGGVRSGRTVKAHDSPQRILGAVVQEHRESDPSRAVLSTPTGRGSLGSVALTREAVGDWLLELLCARQMLCL